LTKAATISLQNRLKVLHHKGVVFISWIQEGRPEAGLAPGSLNLKVGLLIVKIYYIS